MPLAEGDTSSWLAEPAWFGAAPRGLEVTKLTRRWWYYVYYAGGIICIMCIPPTNVHGKAHLKFKMLYLINIYGSQSTVSNVHASKEKQQI